MERQEEEAKAQRQEAARRRTRDLLLERAKQRLLAVAIAAAASTAGTLSPSNSNASSIATGSSGKCQTSSGVEGGGDDIRGQRSSRGDGGQQDVVTASRKISTVTTSCEGGVGTTPTIAMAALSAGTPLYAQETWAARYSKVYFVYCTMGKQPPYILTWNILAGITFCLLKKKCPMKK